MNRAALTSSVGGRDRTVARMRQFSANPAQGRRRNESALAMCSVKTSDAEMNSRRHEYLFVATTIGYAGNLGDSLANTVVTVYESSERARRSRKLQDPGCVPESKADVSVGHCDASQP